MATYGGRRGPNVSQYLRHLNTIPAETTQDDGFIDDDIDLFTNTQFFDFESGQTTDFQPSQVKPDTERASRTAADDTSHVGDLGGLDFISDFNFPEYASYQPSSLPPNFSEGVPLHSLQPSAPVYPTSVPQQQQQQEQQQQQQRPQQHTSYPQHQQPTGEKRKADSITAPAGQFSYEEASRVAAEEDKRRRNTAASARFRVKKKQREQALERTAKEMTEKVTVLEGRIQQLETENKWLKNMILEKNSGGDQLASIPDKGSGSKENSKESKP